MNSERCKEQFAARVACTLIALCLLSRTVRAGATAGALANFEIEGSTNGGTNYSSTINVTAGQTVQFEVWGYLSPVNTVNTNSSSGNPVSTTITSLFNGEDDIIQNNFNLSEANPAAIPITFSQSSLALSNKYNAGAGGPSAGTVTGSTISNIFAAAAGPGSAVPTAASPTLILTGQFVVGSTLVANSTTTIGGAYDSVDDGFGSFRINGGNSVFFYSGTESVSQPLSDYLELTLTDSAPAPEPALFTLLAVLASLLIMRRPRTMLRGSCGILGADAT
jgi:hypothetical protein